MSPKKAFIDRYLEKKISQESVKFRKSLLLLGPRQTGKSTLLKSLKPILSINLAIEAEFQRHSKNASQIELMVAPHFEKGGIVLIDEVQRIPSLMNTIQTIIDDHPNMIFLLSGSTARKLRKAEVNLLPGRLFSHQLFPLTYWELGSKFSLNKCMSIGSLPEVYLNDYGPQLLGEYVNGYLREEIQAEALVRNLSTFSRFVDQAALQAWNEINYSQWASDSEIPKESLRRYLDLLSETLIIYKIAGYTQIQGSRKAVQKEKYLFFDLGVRNGILGIQQNTYTPDQCGPLFEQWILLQLIAFSNYRKLKCEFHYYRDDKQLEVDLVIETPEKILAIEIKWSKQYKSAWKKPLETFGALKHKKRVESIILYRGADILKDSDIYVWPYQRYLDHIEKLAAI
jgi:predicted AAA+ superfamily ATPase